MQYLVTVLDSGKDYTKITEEQEKKLTALIRAKKIPPKIKIGDKEIISDTILGFTDDYQPPVSETSWEEMRKKVHASSWYKRAKGKSAEKPEPIVSPPNESLTFDEPRPNQIPTISQVLDQPNS